MNRQAFFIEAATANDAEEIALLVGELLAEIMDVTGIPSFSFHLDETRSRLEEFLQQRKYFVFVARDGRGRAIGFLTSCESLALYAGGIFGIIPELYVRPEYRSKNIGGALLARAKSFGTARGWKRLEVTTPPLPWFDKTLAFYEREGFTVSGGRKLKLLL